MRIGFVVPSLGPREGQGRANLAMVKAIADARHELDVVAANVPEEVGRLPGVRVHALPRLPGWQFGNQLLGLASSGRGLRGRYDLIHADAGITRRPADVLGVHTVTARWLDLPQEVWRAPGPRGAHEAFATRFKARIELRQARAARAVLANSAQTARDLVARGVDPARITVLPFGVDPQRFSPATDEQRRGARSRFGLDPGDFVVGFVGALGPRKGFDIVLEALSGSDAALLAAGDHRGADPRSRARARGVRAVLPGKLDDVREVYRAVDVLAYPSRYDAFGMVVLEAMACALPVIVSRETGSHDIVGDAGIILERTDAGALRRALTAMRDRDARAAMGEHGRTIAARRSWDETGATLLKLYERSA